MIPERTGHRSAFTKSDTAVEVFERWQLAAKRSLRRVKPADSACIAAPPDVVAEIADCKSDGSAT